MTAVAAALVVILSAAPTGHPLEPQVHELTLSNGMVWLVVERPQAPVFTGFVRIRAGGIDEEQGFTGLAHLFEHMAFKGTPVLGTRDFEKEKVLLEQIAQTGDRLAGLERGNEGQGDEAKSLRQKLAALSTQHKTLTDENALATLYQTQGGVGLNATTDKDLTSYFVSFPKNRLELWLTTEAQRLASPVLRDFYTERDVVQEERRMRIDSNPGGLLYEELSHLSFVGSPYRWPTVGYPADLAAMTLGKAQAFHQKYYAPSNATGCIVGDVKLAEVKALLEKTFALIPARPRPAGPVFSEPVSRSQRRSKVFYDAAGRIYLAFHKPAPPARDDLVFDVLEQVLGEGRTGRLYLRLVQKDKLAQSVGVFTAPGARLPGLFGIGVIPLEGADPLAIEHAIYEELDVLKNELVTERELKKVQNRTTADNARALASNGGIASVLSNFQTSMGDWRYPLRHPSLILTVTPEEVREVARRYFRLENSVFVQLERPAGKVSP